MAVEPFDAGQHEPRVAALKAAAVDVVAGGPLADALSRIAARADSALHASGHLLAVPLPSGDTHVHRVGLGAALEPAAQRLQSRAAGVLTVAGHPVSASQLHSDGFVDLVGSVPDETGIPAGRLVLEVTESQVVADAASGTHLRALRDLDVGVSVDDFGPGTPPSPSSGACLPPS